jgi:hypothetical protein
MLGTGSVVREGQSFGADFLKISCSVATANSSNNNLSKITYVIIFQTVQNLKYTFHSFPPRMARNN